MSGAFEGLGNHPLVFAAGPGFSRGHDFRVRGHKPAQRLDILVVDEGNLF